jgi:AraC family ethanolamine operon transcriptional activator
MRRIWYGTLRAPMLRRYPNCAKVCVMGETPPPLLHRRATIEDPDQIRAAVSGTTIEVDRLSKPVGVSQIEQVGSPSGWALDIGTLRCRLHAEGAFPKASIGVMLVIRSEGTSFCGTEMDDGMLVTIPGGSPIEFSVGPGFSYAGTQIPRDSWFAAQLFETGFIREDSAIEARRLPKERLSDASQRVDQLASLLRKAAGDPARSAGAAVLIEDYVLRLAGEVADLDSVALHHYSGNLQRVAARARDWIYANIESSIRIADLCRSIGVSRRKLEYAFRAVHDVSPLEYIHALRLNMIHRTLLHGEALGLSVTEVALRYGINHFGRFSANYRALFGELPKETLLQARAAHQERGRR